MAPTTTPTTPPAIVAPFATTGRSALLPCASCSVRETRDCLRPGVVPGALHCLKCYGRLWRRVCACGQVFRVTPAQARAGAQPKACEACEPRSDGAGDGEHSAKPAPKTQQQQQQQRVKPAPALLKPKLGRAAASPPAAQKKKFKCTSCPAMIPRPDLRPGLTPGDMHCMKCYGRLRRRVCECGLRFRVSIAQARSGAPEWKKCAQCAPRVEDERLGKGPAASKQVVKSRPFQAVRARTASILRAGDTSAAPFQQQQQQQQQQSRGSKRRADTVEASTSSKRTRRAHSADTSAARDSNAGVVIVQEVAKHPFAVPGDASSRASRGDEASAARLCRAAAQQNIERLHELRVQELAAVRDEVGARLKRARVREAFFKARAAQMDEEVAALEAKLACDERKVSELCDNVRRAICTVTMAEPVGEE